MAIDVASRSRSRRVIDVLSCLISLHDAPAHLRSDNDPVFVSAAILNWMADNWAEAALIDPGKRWQNGTSKSLNAKLQDERASADWFRTRAEANILIESW